MGGLFNKCMREAIDEWKKRGGSGSAETVFKKLTDLVSR
jgi:hypothetical protein